MNQYSEIEFNKDEPLYKKVSNNKSKKWSSQRTKILETHKQKQSRTAPPLIGNIEFKNVWFRFPTRKTFTLKNLNLIWEAGSNCGMVGTSGSGKSTIFQLLLRFYDPQQGTITIDGIDIKTIDLAHLRSLFGLIKQEPEIFNGDIEYNIRYNLTQEKESYTLNKASEMANASEFIVEHPDKFKRDVGNRGDALSGGQKQRITIARVLMKNPKIFLFDEATSALDTNSEKLVQDAIDKIRGDHSSLTIAHRISTIKNCDRIFVLDKGLVKEEGTYAELLSMKGIFYELVSE